MDTSRPPAGSIVVGIDGSPWSEGALDWAVEQGHLEQRPVVLAHAVSSMGSQGMGIYATSGLEVARLLDIARADGQVLVDDASARVHHLHPELEVHEVMAVTDARNLLLELGEQAAMVVVGSRGRGPVASLLLGSVSVSVSKHATCPVIVWRTGGPEPAAHRTLVGVDGSADSLPAIEFAFRTASFRRSGLSVLHCCWPSGPVTASLDAAAWPDLGAESALVSESLAGMAEKFPDVEVTVRVVPGFADQQLVAASVDHDLVVVGHRRISRLDDLLHDSLAPAVLEHATGSIAVVPSAGRSLVGGPFGTASRRSGNLTLET